jgi:hypothetical protein
LAQVLEQEVMMSFHRDVQLGLTGVGHSILMMVQLLKKAQMHARLQGSLHCTRKKETLLA